MKSFKTLSPSVLMNAPTLGIDQPLPGPILPKRASASTHQAPNLILHRFHLDGWPNLRNQALQSGLPPSAVLMRAFLDVLAIWSESPEFATCLTLCHPQRLPFQINLNTVASTHPASQSFLDRARALQVNFWENMSQRKDVLTQTMPSEDHPGVSFVDTLAMSNDALPGQAENILAWAGVSAQPLSLIISAKENELLLDWIIADPQLAQGAIVAMAQAYFALVRRLSAEPQYWEEAQFDLLPSAQQLVRSQTNATQGPVSDQRLHDFFLDQARIQANAPAVITPSHRLSYGALREQVQGWAAALTASNLEPEALVAIFMEKGWEQVVATLAILEAGGAYLPLDPNLPDQRIALLLERTGARHVLTQSQFAERLAGYEGLSCFCLDQAPPAAAKVTPCPTAASDLAYVIFTSGSTGEPKGVKIDHRGAVNTILDINQRFSITEQDRILGLSALNFDLSVYDIFGMLGAGGTLVLPSADRYRDPEHWLDLLQSEAITCWNTVPQLFQMLVDYAPAQLVLPHLRLVLLSGDWIPLSLPERIKAIAPAAQVISLGGATEASIWSILHPIGELDPNMPSVPYGKPMVNQRFYVLDEKGSPRPDWVAGDLYIGGIGLALGYWRDKERTDAAFLNHPFTGERLYRTGDRGRYLPDGSIEFLGRIDTQVKVRGYRIELGEIEAALLELPQLSQAQVGTVPGPNNSKQLIAYISLANNQGDAAISRFKQQLALRLPDYMLPVYWVVLGSWPLTANGKIDRKALAEISPELWQTDSSDSAHFAAPETAEETLLCQIWGQLLGREHMGIHDNFYEYGGDSIIAIQVIARARKAGLQLSAGQLLQYQTIAELAALTSQQVDGNKTHKSAPQTWERFALAQLAPAELDQLKVRWPQLEDVYPLSPLQQGILFQTLFNAESPAYFVHQLFTLEGDVDPEIMETAWQRTVAHFDTLRIAMLIDHETAASQPHQFVAGDVVVPFTSLDWSSLADAECRQALDDFLAADRQRGFDLSKPPLLRIALIRTAQNRYSLILSLHHLIVDGWSIPVLAAWVFDTYQQCRMNATPVAEKAHPFRNYIAWLNGLDQGTAAAFWEQYLQGFQTPTPLPIAAGQKPSQQLASTFMMSLSHQESRALQEFAATRRLTANIVCQFAWGLLLSHYCQHNDVVFGVTVAGRPPELEGVESMIGLFINSLPLRVRLEPDRSVLEHLHELRANQTRWEPCQYTALHEIGARVGLSGSGSLFNTLFVFQSYPIESYAAKEGKLPFVVVDFADIEQTHYPLDIVILPGANLGIKLTYDPALYDPQAMARMAAHYANLLRGVVESEAQMPFQISMLDPDERTSLLQDWNQSERSYPNTACLHQRFEAVAAQCPDEIALIQADAQLSYSALNERAEFLARRLSHLGSGPEVIIGLAAERSIDMVVALLAILKTGATYLPLAVNLPKERRLYMLEDTHCKLLLCDEAGWGDLAATPTDLNIVRIDKTPQLEHDPLPKPHLPSNLAACVIYTSGSTGKPKGTTLAHGALVNKMTDLGRRFAITPPYRHMLISPIGFDPFLEQLFVPLLHGGTAVIFPNAESMESSTFWSAVAYHRIDTIDLVPSLMSFLLSDVTPVQITHQPQRILLGGEVLPRPLWQQLGKLGLDHVYNFYGPTEATVDALCHLIPSDHQDAEIPLGQAMDNYRIYLLDRRLEPAPLGVSGELIIGGEGLARGYHHRPGQTAAVFLPDPFSAQPGARMYRSGDAARRRQDGAIVFMGRLDQQVKIRGFRVELGEIENVLAQSPLVAKATVLAIDKPRGPELQAFLVLAEQQTPQAAVASIRNWCNERMPKAMLPHHFTCLAQIPTNANGKVDLAALKSLAQADQIGSVQNEKPATHEEQLLASLWAEILNIPIEELGVFDSFFARGGHSLSAARLASRIRSRFAVEFPIRDIFEHATLRAMAEKLQAGRGADATTMPVPVARPSELPLSFAQSRLWLMDRLVQARAIYNIPFAFQLLGPLCLESVSAALNRVIERHESLRTNFIEVKQTPIQAIAAMTPFHLRVIDLSGLPSDQRQRQARQLADRDALRPFRLDRDRLFRAHLLRLSSDDHVLVMNLHHIIADGASVEILLDELRLLYRATLTDAADLLPAPLALQYADYTLWQQGEAHERNFENQLAYWKDQLQGAPPQLELPTKGPRPSVQTYHGDRITFTMEANLAHAVNKLALQTQTTLFIVLEAAFAELLGRFAAAAEVNLGTPVANRNFDSLEGLIGLFVNTVVLRNRRDQEDTVHERLHKTRQLTTNAFHHKDLPFERVVEAVRPQRNTSSSALFQVMFYFEKTAEVELDLLGLAVSSWPQTYPIAKFDLNFGIRASGEAILGDLEFNTDLFDRSTIETLLRGYFQLLEGFSRGLDHAVCDLSLLSESEQLRLLSAWNSFGITNQNQRSEAEWHSFLADLPDAAHLPQPLTQERQARPTQATLDLDAAVAQALQARAKAQGLALSSVLLAAFTSTLSHWSESAHFSVSVQLSAAQAPSLQAQVATPQQRSSFSQRALLLQQQLDAYAGLLLRNGEVGKCWIDATLSVIDNPVTFTLNPSGDPGAVQVLTLAPLQQKTGLKLQWSCDATQFPDGVFTHICDGFATLLEELARHDATWHCLEYSVLPQAQVALRAEINATEWHTPPQLLHEGFLETAARQALAAAVLSSKGKLSYGELRAQSGSWANRLRQHGLAANQICAVFMEKGWEQVVAVLAILEAGGAYLPLDAHLPDERVAYLLENTQAAMIMTQPHLNDRLEHFQLVRMVVDDQVEILAPPTPQRSQGDDLAYIIFTSGSTGKPKGVAIDHRGASNTIHDMNARFEVGQNDRVLAMAALNFDLSVYDVFGLLSAGGALVLPDAAALRDPKHWTDLMDEHDVTLWNTVPQLMQMLVDCVPDGTHFPKLRHVFLSGDWIPMTLPEKIWAIAPQTAITSLGGATEASIWSILHPIGSIKPNWKSIPYGKPMANQQFYVLDAHLQDRPDWVVGDLYIGGVGLAQGYWQDPVRTAAAFVTHPVSGKRLYRTGDLGRYHDDGNIEFLGRKDGQVKIRGYRVELGEIQATLLRHEAVEDCYVLVDQAQDKHLVAFIKRKPDAAAFEPSAFLAQSLPEYMVPTVFVYLENLPLTSNAKVDHKALLQLAKHHLEQVSYEDTDSYIAPRNGTEERLSVIWGELLELDPHKIGIHDNFFDMGVSSLGAARLSARISAAFELEFPLVKVFQHPTIAAIGEILLDLREASAPEEAPQKRSCGSVTPMSHNQRRLWFIDQMERGNPAYNVPYALCLEGLLDLQCLQAAFDQIIGRHEILRTRFEVRESIPSMVIEPSLSIPLQLIDLSPLPQPLAESLAIELANREACIGFQLERVPLLRVRVVRISPTRCHLLLNLHHMICDAWSIEILQRELQQTYQRLVRGQETASLAVPKLQYADYALWQDERYRGPFLEKQLEYWKRQLKGAPFQLNLPTRQARPKLQSFNGANVALTVKSSLLQQLKKLVQETQSSLFMVLETAFAELLGRASGDPEVNLGTPVANRGFVALEDVMGLFVTTLVLRNPLDAFTSVRERIHRTRETVLAAFQHQDMPFELLVEAINPPRDTSRSALFQAMFAYDVSTLDQLALPGVNASTWQQEYRRSKFDLSMGITELPDSLIVNLEYNTNLFEQETMQVLLHGYHQLLEGFVQQPDEQVANLPLISPAEQGRLLKLLAPTGTQKAAPSHWDWRQFLADLPAPASLPSGFHQGDATLSQHRSVIAPAIVAKLEHAAQAQQLTLSNLLLTTYLKVLATWNKDMGLSLQLVLGSMEDGLQTLVTYHQSSLPIAEQAQIVQDQLARALGPVLCDGPSGEKLFSHWRRDHGHDANLPIYYAWNSDLDALAARPGLRFALAIDCQDTQLSLHWLYQEHRLADSVAHQIISTFERILSQVAEQEGFWQEPLEQILTEDELHARMRANDTAMHLSTDLLHQGFLEQAQRHPEAVALIAPQRRFSYGQLRALCGSWAALLRREGVVPNQLVAVFMEKGWEQVVAVLAILEAGGAYLPLDAKLPQERLEYLLTCTETKIVLTQSRFAPRLASFTGEVFSIDQHKPIEAPPAPVAMDCDQLAYVIFTSGSTGLPKGVVITHRSALNTIRDINQRFEISAQDRVLALSALNFDLSVYDIFGLFYAGGALVLPEAEGLRDPAHWLDLMAQHRISLWNTVPQLMQMLVEYAEELTDFSDLRLTLLSGDWIPLSLPDRIRALAPHGQVISLGGATEAAIWSILYPITQIDPAWKSIPYGKPMGNQAFHVLDDHFNPKPTWVAGDLFIGGIGLAQGYWRDPERSSASLVIHPRTGEKLYRTGDKGRYLPDGNIEFLGRDDGQVKIRGFRIELGEIESALLRHQAVEDCVVLVDDGRAGKSLAGFIKHRQGLDPFDPTTYLASLLPDYMVPTAIVYVETMPLTSNGKVDRNALLQLLADGTSARISAKRSPRTADERIIAQIWGELLGRDPEHFCVTENFFDLGGQSLNATRLCLQIRARFDVDFPLHMIFEHTSIAEQARLIPRLRSDNLSLPQPTRADRNHPIPLSFAQNRLWIMSRMIDMGATYHIPVTLHLKGALRVKALRASLNVLVQNHESLRTCFAEDEFEATQIIREYRKLDFPVIDLSGVDAEVAFEAAKALADADVERPFDLLTGPLFRVHLIRIDAHQHLFVMNIHHIIFDGWSMDVLLDELSRAYSEPERHLKEPDLQYADYAVWQRQWLKGEVLDQQLAYWVKELGDAPQILNLPLDAKRPEVQTYNGDFVPIVLEPELSLALRALAKDTRSTLFIVLQTAFAELIGRYSNCADVCVGTPVANRRFAEFEGILGCFVNTLVLRNRLQSGTVTERLSSMRKTTLDAFAHQDLPFEKLVDALKPPRNPAYSPLFQILFTMDPPIFKDLTFSGLEIGTFEQEYQMAKFDLSMGFRELDETLEGYLEYNTDLFKKETAQAMANAYHQLLKGFVQQPDEQVANLPLISPAEQGRLLKLLAPTGTQKATPSHWDWRSFMATLPTPASLPSGLQAQGGASLSHHRSVITPAIVAKLEHAAQAQQLTLSNLLLTTYLKVLATWNKDMALSLQLVLGSMEDGLQTLVTYHQSSLPIAEQTQIVQAQLARALGPVLNDGPIGEKLFSHWRGNHDHDANLPIYYAWNCEPHALAARPGLRFALAIESQETELNLHWLYQEHRLADSVAHAIISTYERILSQLAEQEGFWQEPLEQILSESELQARQLANDTAWQLSTDILHSGFLKQAQRHPEAVALIAPQRSFSYGQLRALSGSWAALLRRSGVVPNQLVAVFMEKGWEQVVAVMAILEAGGAYLPLDAKLPQERLEYLLTCTETKIVLTQSAFAPRLVSFTGGVFSIDQHTPDEAAPAPMEMDCDQLAYVIFTSGSTGLPKGVVITHRSALNTIRDLNQRFEIRAEDRVLALSALNFDLSVYDIFAMLHAGGALVFPEAEGLRDPGHWLDLMSMHRISLWNTVPQLMQMLVEYAEETTYLDDLRLTMLSGDWIPLSLPERVRALAPNTAVVSLGGATEAAIWSILHPIDQIDPAWKSIPYGKPMRNQQCHILDGHLNHKPAWVAGDLYIGGIGLAQGYWRDPERTSAAFVIHPRTGERLYRTGDMGRYMPDGSIEFLGRDDGQVKIRGFRIELGEIESALLRHKAVEDCVVLVEEGRAGKRLAGFIKRRQGHDTFDPATHLANLLPDYMVPGAFVNVETMPLTSNAKVDRKALLQLLSRTTDLRATAPRLPISEDERMLAQIWGDLLGRDPEHLCVTDNFFDIGGQSLNAMRLCLQIRTRFEVDFPLRLIFDYRTIADQASYIPRLRSENLSLPQPTRADRDLPLPLSFSQNQLWTRSRMVDLGATYHIPLTLQLKGPLRVKALCAALNMLVQNHESLRTCFAEGSEFEATQVIRAYRRFDLPVIDLSDVEAEVALQAAKTLADADVERPFDLLAGPLFRFYLIRVEAHLHLLVINIHHIIFDGWSMGVLLDELSRTYSEPEQQLQEPSLQYADFAAWQRQYLQGEVLEQQLAYWSLELGDAPYFLKLPTDAPRPEIQTFKGNYVPIPLEPALSLALRALAKETRSTLFVILQAAFAELVGRYSNSADVCIGTPVANRRFAEFEGTLGCFVNTLVLRNRLQRETVAQRLSALRQTTLNAFAHQDLPFEKLEETLNPPRDNAYSPLFQVMFTMDPPIFDHLTFTGLEVDYFEQEYQVAKYDLNLGFRDLNGALEGSLEYNTDLFQHQTIQNMARHYVNLLRAFTAVETPMEQISMLDQEELALVLEATNRSRDCGQVSALLAQHADPATNMALTPAQHAAVLAAPEATSLLVLDFTGNPLPLGIPGKAYVTGTTASPGYQGESARTAAAFVPNPFAQQAGDRMFKLNGLISATADGHLNYLGENSELHLKPSITQSSANQIQAASNTTEQILLEIWTQLLGGIGDWTPSIHQNFFEASGDSIMAIQMVTRARRKGLYLTPLQVFKHQTIFELAQHATAVTQSHQNIEQGELPLSTAQTWFFQLEAPYHHFNIPRLMRLPFQVAHKVHGEALLRLILHHDALRLRVRQEDGVWRQAYSEPPQKPLNVPFHDLSMLPETERRASLEQLCNSYQREIRLDHPPLLRAAVFRLFEHEPDYLFLTMHHLAIDAVSLRFIMNDLYLIYESLHRQTALELPPKTSSFQTWTRYQALLAQSPSITSQLDYWQKTLAPEGVLRISDDATRPGTMAESGVIKRRLELEATQYLLDQVPTAFASELGHVWLATLTRAMVRWNQAEQRGAGDLLLTLEMHGRTILALDDPEAPIKMESLDLTNTVGWFTSSYPMRLDTSHEDRQGALAAIAANFRNLPGEGVGYELLRFINPETAATLGKLTPPRISFNYVGQLDAGLEDWVVSDWSTGDNRNTDRTPEEYVQFLLIVEQGRLEITIYYAGRVIAESSAHALIDTYCDELHAFIEAAKATQLGGSDPASE